MTLDHSQRPDPRSETFEARTRRVAAERSEARRTRLLEYLLNPVVVAEDVEALNTQANSVYLAFKPRNGWQDWLTGEIAVIMIRINRCTRIERRMRDYASYRAIDFWEDDQKVIVETLALKIHRDPARTVAKLRLTPVGCDWLQSRWRVLAKTNPTEWSEEQHSLASVLVGGDPSVDPTLPGFAAGQVAELEARWLRVKESDEIARGPRRGRHERRHPQPEPTPALPVRPPAPDALVHRPVPRRAPPSAGMTRTASPASSRKPASTVSASASRRGSFAEPALDLNKTKPTPASEVASSLAGNETKPSAPAPEPTGAETKPTDVGSNFGSDETKPFAAVGSLAAAFKLGSNQSNPKRSTVPAPA